MKKFLISIAIVSMIISGTLNFPMINNYSTISNVEAKTKIKLNSTSKVLVKGKTYQLKISGTKKKVKWSSSKKSVATVTSKGKVTAKKSGIAYIYAKVSGKTYKCKIKVETPSLISSKTIYKGYSYTLKVSGNTQKVSWSSSKKSVATVTSKGKVTAKKNGTAYIYAKVSGKTMKCKVTVKTKPKTLTKEQRLKKAKEEAKRIIKKIHIKGMTQYQKAEAICHYLSVNVSSNIEQSNAAYKKNYGNEAYAALVLKKAACSGYCKAVVLLCNEAKISVKHINAGQWRHQWNEVKINGKWLELDSQIGYLDGKKTVNRYSDWAMSLDEIKQYTISYLKQLGFNNIYIDENISNYTVTNRHQISVDCSEKQIKSKIKYMIKETYEVHIKNKNYGQPLSLKCVLLPDRIIEVRLNDELPLFVSSDKIQFSDPCVIVINKNEKYQLNLINNTSKSVSYRVSNTGILSINQNGVLTGKRVGEGIALALDYQNHSCERTIYVANENDRLESINTMRSKLINTFNQFGIKVVNDISKIKLDDGYYDRLDFYRGMDYNQFFKEYKESLFDDSYKEVYIEVILISDASDCNEDYLKIALYYNI